MSRFGWIKSTRNMATSELSCKFHIHSNHPIIIRSCDHHHYKCRYKLPPAALRLKYKQRGEVFLEEHIDVKEPISLFRKWLDVALANTDIIEPNAMCLSTTTK